MAYGSTNSPKGHAQRTQSVISGLDGVLVSTGVAIAHTYNIRPIQKLAQHTEDSEPRDQLPSARTKSKPYGIPGSLNLFQQVIQENEEAQHRPQLITVGVMIYGAGSEIGETQIRQ